MTTMIRLRRDVTSLPTKHSMSLIHPSIRGRRTTNWILRSRNYVTLEVPSKQLSPAFRKLAKHECFDGFVTPDLPFHSKFSDLLKLERWRHVRDIPRLPFLKKDALNVKTIAAQARTKKFLLKLILHYGEQMEALLCLSGDSYLRKLPFSHRFLQDSLWILDQARRLKEQRVLAKSLQLWAVTNPNKVTDLYRLQLKVDLGAEVILTQPPLLKNHFENWLELITRKQITKAVNFEIGIPIITSFELLRFWCVLAEIPETQLDEILPQGHEFSHEFWFDWNKRFITEVKSYGIGGLHIMPITNQAQNMTLNLLEQHPELFFP